MHALFAIGGIIILVVTVVDVVWTTVGTHGGGPVSSHLSGWMWKIALALHKKRPHHRALSFAGSIILVATVAFWIALVWLGWFAVFSSDPHALVDSHTKAPADAWARAYFVAYSISTMGNGDYQPATSLWRIVTAIMTLSGIGAITVAITYIVAVLSAVVEKRSLGAYVSDLGGEPRKIIERSWTGEEFDSLEGHMLALTPMVQHVAEQHLAFPVLHYFHSESARSAATLRLAAMYELLVLVGDGAVKEKRPPRMVLEPLRSSIEAFAMMISSEYEDPEPTSPPPPPLRTLSERGVPTIEDEEFRRCVAKHDEARRSLATLVHQDGWSWNEVIGEKMGTDGRTKDGRVKDEG